MIVVTDFFGFLWQYLPQYVAGLGVGLLIAVIATALSLVIGFFAALARRSSHVVLRGLASAYVAVFRGVPPLVLMYVIYFGLPAWALSTGGPFFTGVFEPLNNPVISASIALGINSGAYSAEIIRASLSAIGEDQHEAARSIGMSRQQAMRRVVLPQALRVAFPTLGNEFVITLKGTSLASVIGAVELMRVSQIIAANTLENLTAYAIAGIYYVAVVILIQLALGAIDRRTPGSANGPATKRPRASRRLPIRAASPATH